MRAGTHIDTEIRLLDEGHQVRVAAPLDREHELAGIAHRGAMLQHIAQAAVGSLGRPPREPKAPSMSPGDIDIHIEQAKAVRALWGRV